MTDDADRPVTSLPRRASGASAVTVAAVLMAASGFLAVMIAARTLSKPENGDFLVAWSLLFALTGALAALQAEASRSTSAPPAPTGARTSPIVGSALLVGGVVAAAVIATGATWVPFFGVQGSPWPVLAPIAIGVVAYAGHSAAVGALLGQDAHIPAATVVGAEALARLAAFVLVAALAASVGGFLWAAALPMVVWPLAGLATREGRQVWGLRAPDALGIHLRHYAYAVASGACTSILVNGYPALLRLTAPAHEVDLLPDAILSITLTRAPLLLPLLAFQGMVVALLVRTPQALGRLLGGLWLAVGILAGAMALLGPWAIRLLYGALYDVPAATMALFTLGAGSTTSLVVCAAAALAASQHRWYLLAWVVGTVASLALLWAPLPLVPRITLSLGVGPLAGAALALRATGLGATRPSRRAG